MFTGTAEHMLIAWCDTSYQANNSALCTLWLDKSCFEWNVQDTGNVYSVMNSVLYCTVLTIVVVQMCYILLFIAVISLTHWTAWPAMGRCAFQTLWSPAMSQAGSATSPTSISSWRIQVCRGQPRGGCFHAGLSLGWWPAWELTTRRSASCAGTDSCRRRTWPNTEICLSRILL